MHLRLKEDFSNAVHKTENVYTNAVLGTPAKCDLRTLKALIAQIFMRCEV